MLGDLHLRTFVASLLKRGARRKEEVQEMIARLALFTAAFLVAMVAALSFPPATATAEPDHPAIASSAVAGPSR